MTNHDTIPELLTKNARERRAVLQKLRAEDYAAYAKLQLALQFIAMADNELDYEKRVAKVTGKGEGLTKEDIAIMERLAQIKDYYRRGIAAHNFGDVPRIECLLIIIMTVVGMCAFFLSSSLLIYPRTLWLIFAGLCFMTSFWIALRKR